MAAGRGEFQEVEFGGNQLLVLDGRVVEYFKRDQPPTAGGWRWHVRHLAVEAKPRRDGGLSIHLGRERHGRVWAQATAEVPPQDVPTVLRFFEAAKRESAT
ncbi:hypothetical protein [Streptomyces sp. NPDC005805]|uniref:hypothetical protein n=1 Tax=Streptomyces sp. NPDC005805 TaxID=3157068 RepID=UPI0033F95EA1